MQGNEIASWDKAATVNAAVVGDPFPFGIEKNRKALEAITQFAVDQKHGAAEVRGRRAVRAGELTGPSSLRRAESRKLTDV